MIFMVVFEALTNGLKAAILVGTGLECLLYSLNANVGERGGFTAVGADSGFSAGWRSCWCLPELVFLRFCCGLFTAVSAGTGF